MKKNTIVLDAKATELMRNLVGGGGTIKVDELPEVGKEHTIYELTEEVEVGGTYNWVLEADFKFGSSVIAKVIETSADLPEEVVIGNMYYVRTEDKLFRGVPGGEDDDPIWQEIPHAKDGNDNDLVGIFIDSDNKGYYSIVKDYLEKTEDGSGTTFKYVLLDDTRYDLFIPVSEDIGYGVRTSKLVEVQKAEIANSIMGYPTIVIQEESELPTYQQAVVGGLVNEDGDMIYCYATLQGNAWYDGWVDDEEQIIVWDSVDKLDIENEIHFTDDYTYLFVRQNGGIVTKTSYWIYSDDEWFNVDELGSGSDDLKLGINSYGVDDYGIGQKELPLDWLKLEICTNYDGEEELEYEELPIITYATYKDTEREILYNEYYNYLGYISGYPMPTSDNRMQHIRLSVKDDIINPFSGGSFFVRINNNNDWRIGDGEAYTMDIEGLTSITLNVQKYPF